uniref:Uncharacterized protein n=1 Tax=Glossina pallidipes TaxID=7398 RepID=A0A1A9ZQ82_GLOPL
MNEGEDRCKQWLITQCSPSKCEGDNNEKQKPETVQLAKFIIKVKPKSKRDPQNSLPHYTITSNFVPTTKFIITASDVFKGKTLLKFLLTTLEELAAVAFKGVLWILKGSSTVASSFVATCVSISRGLLRKGMALSRVPLLGAKRTVIKFNGGSLKEFVGSVSGKVVICDDASYDAVFADGGGAICSTIPCRFTFSGINEPPLPIVLLVEAVPDEVILCVKRNSGFILCSTTKKRARKCNTSLNTLVQ